VLGAKARAALNGRFMVRKEDVLKVAVPVLGHRLLTTFNAESDGVNGRQIVARLAAEFEQQGDQ
jgi:MoxR-like ATPase